MLTIMGVTGIGGIFFRARDPAALKRWYLDQLGVGGEGYEPWQQQAGPTAFTPFSADSDHWPADRQWMLNLRVDQIDPLLKRLRAAGIAVETREEWDAYPEIGRFARIVDPEGNPIELWQPAEE